MGYEELDGVGGRQTAADQSSFEPLALSHLVTEQDPSLSSLQEPLPSS